MACLTREQLEALAENGAGPGEAAACRQHIEQCDTCRRKLEELRANERPPGGLEDPRRSDTTDLTADSSTPDATGSSATCASPAAGGRAFSSLPADSFAGYQIVKEIHRGGQGVVYQALQISTSASVALKVMKEGPFASLAEKARFEREIEILGPAQPPQHRCDPRQRRGRRSLLLRDGLHQRPGAGYVDGERPALDRGDAPAVREDLRGDQRGRTLRA